MIDATGWRADTAVNTVVNRVAVLDRDGCPNPACPNPTWGPYSWDLTGGIATLFCSRCETAVIRAEAGPLLNHYFTLRTRD